MNNGRLTRHHLIVELVQREPVQNQEELRRLLTGRGIRVTQATLSRDLRELGLVKSPAGYQVPGTPEASSPIDNGKLPTAVQEFVIGADAAKNLVVLRTPPGGAQPLAIAIDRSRPRGVLGTLAGDDTVLVVTRTDRAAQTLVKNVRTWRTNP
jgi:transcriptional regulator of arginine metabolism